MSTAEASAVAADAAEVGGRTKTGSPRTIPVFGVAIPDGEMQVRPGREAGAGKGVRLQGNGVECGPE